MGQALCCVQVDHSTVAIIENCGMFGGVLQPGCHYVPWCLGHRVAGHLSLRVQQLDLRCETKTKDNISVTVVTSIQYRALKEKPDVAFHELSNIRKQIQKFVFDVISASVRKLNLDDTFEQKNDIAKAVENELKQAMLNFGYETVQTLIVDIEPDEHVKRAINKNIAAARLRSSAYEKDEAEKMLLIKLTETERESKLQAGQGIAKQRDAIVGDYIGNVRAFSNEMPEAKVKDLMDTVLAASILRP